MNEIAMILEEPIHTVIRAPAFFVGGEGDDDVAVGLEAFALVLDEIGDPSSGLCFVVPGAAAIKEAIALAQLERVHTPVFAFGFDDIGVGKEEDGFAGAGAAITNDEIRLLGNCAADEDVGVWEARGF